MASIVLRIGSATAAYSRSNGLPKVCRSSLSIVGSSDGLQHTGDVRQRQPHQHQQRWGHTVRIIAMEDLPHGKAYKGDVVHVRAGYARNHLIPSKKAVYAIPQNFKRYDISDPEVETEEDRLARLEREKEFLSQEDEQKMKQADRLKHYLRNKVLKMWRMVDPNSADSLHPGRINSWNIRHKLSKQLKIDLEDHETLHIYNNGNDETPIHFSELDDRKIQQLMDEMETSEPCTMEIKRLGEYLCRIGLDGGHAIPLKLVVSQRMP